MKTIKGDLIKLALAGEFDVIVHGCNCFCTQKSGIAKQMAESFATHKYDSERYDKQFNKHNYGDIRKLGNIEWGVVHITSETRTHTQKDKSPYIYTGHTNKINSRLLSDGWSMFYVVNAYTQYYHLGNMPDTMEIPVDYNAIYLCFCKIAKQFKGKKIGIPKIGSGLARGNWYIIESMIQYAFKDYGDINDLTIVEYE